MIALKGNHFFLFNTFFLKKFNPSLNGALKNPPKKAKTNAGFKPYTDLIILKCFAIALNSP